jgi:mono/diheme cytochrome c family protein
LKKVPKGKEEGEPVPYDFIYFLVRPWRSWRLGGSLFLLLLLPACQQEMAGQPSYRPLRPSDFFSDGRSARPIPAGTIARGLEPADSPLMTGLHHPEKPHTGPEEEYVDAFPFRVSEEDLRRGQDRYTIYCAVCHDPLGNADGKIVERGYVKPPNFHTDYSRGIDRRWNRKVPLPQVPVGYYFEVISRGYGAMPDYAAQVKPRDRWLIIAYIRALQLSQHARLQDLPEEDRRKAQEALNEENKR